MTAQKQFTGGSSAWNTSHLYNVSEQTTKTNFQVFVFTGSNMWTDFDTLEVKDFVTS